MKQLGRLLVLICVLALMGFAVGCDGGNTGGDETWEPEMTHNPNWTPEDCLGCHEDGGTTPPKKLVHAHTRRCARCHDNVTNHSSESFTNASCTTCHTITCRTCHGFGNLQPSN